MVFDHGASQPATIREIAYGVNLSQVTRMRYMAHMHWVRRFFGDPNLRCDYEAGALPSCTG